MKINHFFILLGLFTLVNCGGLQTEEQKAEAREKEASAEFEENINEAKKDFEGAFSNIGEAITSLKKKHNVEDKEPINFRDIKSLLPEDINGVEMVDSEGQTTGFMGFKISTVEAVYKEDKTRLEVKIIDIAGIGALASKMADWSTLEIDKESKDGYERTTTIDGYKAYEKYNNHSKRGKVAIIVDDRFVIDIDGSNVSERQLRNAMDEINIRKLKRLAN